MIKLSNFKSAAVILITLSLFGCGEEDEAKKLGFSSVAEMTDMHAKGWHTKQQYDEDQAKAAGFASVAEMQIAAVAEAIAAKQAEDVRNREKIELASRQAAAMKICDWNILGEIISFASNKGNISNSLMEIGHSIAWEGSQNGYAVEEDKERQEKKKIIKIGRYDFNGRNLPICLEEITIHYINRSEGKRKTECYQVGYAKDSEFNMYRNIMTTTCQESDKKIAAWQANGKVTDLK